MTRKALTTLVLALGLAVAPAAFAVPMDNGRSETTTTTVSRGMSQEEYRALTLRGEALNRIYGNAATRLTAAQFKALYTAGGYRLDPQELAALVARGQQLNTQYGGGLNAPYVAPASSQPYHAVTTVRPDENGPDGIVKADQIPSATVATIRPDENGPDGIVKADQMPSATAATVRPDVVGPDGLDKSSQISSATTTGDDGFEWNSAAIGAGTFAFVALLAIASFVLTRRRHHPSF